MTVLFDPHRIDRTRARLWAEFLALYVLAPLGMALLLPPGLMFPMLFAVTALGLVLLHFTPGFHWADLRHGARDIPWRLVAAFTAITAAACFAVIFLFAPDQLFNILRQQPAMILVIVTLYPVLSALPQELVYRPLFFRRYGMLLPGVKQAIVLNAALFSAAHLMYWSWVVAVMTFFGGLIFAKTYEVKGSFALSVLLHSIAGNLIFIIGLGIYFYSGNVQRPF